MHTDIDRLCVSPECPLADAIASMDAHRLGITLIVDSARRLVGTITDGDVRRAILRKVDLRQPVETLLAQKAGTAYARPISARADAAAATHLQLLQQHNILHLPVVDAQGRVTGLVTRDDFLPGQPLPVEAVVMAGGAGSRLMPLTTNTPKPLLPVGDRPMMEIIVARLKASGVRRLNVALHHHGDKIREHFANGAGFGIEIAYVDEERPLGTAGALGLMEPWRETMLVINGDILTEVDFRAMFAYHREHQADLTLGVARFEVKVPYGVVECDAHAVIALREKPVLSFFVNAGIYLIDPAAQRWIPRGCRFDMTELIAALVAGGRTVVSFPIHESWLDIGAPEDYERAQGVVANWRAEA